MVLTASLEELVGLAIAVMLSAAASGFLAGLFGIGGGAVIVPILYQGFTFLGVDEAIRMHLAVGTSLAIIVPTSIRSFLSHRKRGAVDMQLLRDWLIPVPLGVIAGSAVVAMISGTGLRAIFAVVVGLIGLRLIINRASWKLGDQLPGNPVRAVVGFVVGLLSTWLGIGGGVLNNTFMTLFSRPIHQAVATSSGTGVLISVPGILGFMWAGWNAPDLPPFSVGFVNILGMLLMIPISIWVAPYGVALAHRLSRRRLEISFGIFLLLVSIRFFFSLD